VASSGFEKKKEKKNLVSCFFLVSFVVVFSISVLTPIQHITSSVAGA